MRVIVNPKYAHLQKEIEEIPRSFQKERDVVYDGRNVLKRIGLGSIDVVVKSFKKPHIINRVVYSFFRQSKAERSYIYSMEIQQHGFDTPEPVAMIEQFQNGLLSHSYYICCYDGGETVRSLMDGKVEGNEDKLSAFARYTAALHQAGILHLDYSPGNILIHQNETNEYSFSLVDVNRMQLLSDIDCDIVSLILFFRLYRSVRKFFSWEPHISRFLLKKEKHIYDTYLCKYDYCELLSADYQ